VPQTLFTPETLEELLNREKEMTEGKIPECKDVSELIETIQLIKKRKETRVA
jgi:hypothetical protein